MIRRDFLVLLSAPLWCSISQAQTARKRPIVGVLIHGTPAQLKGLPYRQMFLDGLRELGSVDGRDFEMVARSAGSISELPKAAEELVQINPDVIMAGASAHAFAAKQATSTIPIVVAVLGNPAALGLTETDSRRPGGNLTGVMPYVSGLPAKQLELAREIVPAARTIGVLNDTADIKATPQWEEIKAVAARLEIRIVGADARSPEDIEPAFRTFAAQHVDVIIVLQTNLLLLERVRIAGAAAAARLPTVFGYRELVDAGGLISYGVNVRACFHRAGALVHRILNGARVADLPVEFPTRVELVINLKTARALGLHIPPTLLARADEVIE